MQRKRHTIITGTGRSGTTFLVQLFTVLGYETGFDDPWAPGYLNTISNAGMECLIRAPQAPYIVKSPTLCTDLDAVMAEGKTVIDHAFIPMRDLYSAAESRRDVERRTRSYSQTPAPGGLWGVMRADEQEIVLARKLYELIATLAKWNIPHTLLSFPRIVHDPAYLYEKLGPVLGDCTMERFQQGFAAVARPELVHEFAVVPKKQLVATD